MTRRAKAPRLSKALSDYGGRKRDSPLEQFGTLHCAPWSHAACFERTPSAIPEGALRMWTSRCGNGTSMPASRACVQWRSWNLSPRSSAATSNWLLLVFSCGLLTGGFRFSLERSIPRHRPHSSANRAQLAGVLTLRPRPSTARLHRH